MLINFKLKNFLSFYEKSEGEPIVFSMIAGNVKSKNSHIYEDKNIKLLKFASIHGANASGKSNFVKALYFMKEIVLKGKITSERETMLYSKVRKENKDKPSYFEVEVKINEKYYAYGFEIILNKGKFVSEWLYEIFPDNSEKYIFIRDFENFDKRIFQIKNSSLKNKIENYFEDVQNDDSILFLNIMNTNKKDLYTNESEIDIFKKVFDWFNNSLSISFPDVVVSNFTEIIKPENINKIEKLIYSFGTGISKIKVEYVSYDEVISKLPLYVKKDIEDTIFKLNDELMLEKKAAGFVYRGGKDFFIIIANNDGEKTAKAIKFIHESIDEPFNISEESDGTVRLLDLLEILISNDSKTYVIDELDRRLHPSLTKKFVEKFLELISKRNIQLIVTTHESRLLNLDILRRDEVWLVEKEKNGGSRIYSLEDYRVRFDQKIDKAYLDGRYGGVPIFDNDFLGSNKNENF